MKVLALGYLPKWRGGLQTTGLATGIFDLHDAVNELNDGVEVTIVATDVFKDRIQVENTPVVGWTKVLLFKHAVKRFYRLPFFICKALWISRRAVFMPYMDTLAKLLLLDRAIDKIKPDVIHFHGDNYAYFVNALWHNNKSVVLRLHGMDGFDSTIKGYKELRRVEKEIVGFKYNFVTFVTKDVCEDWKIKYGKFDCPMIPIINGFNDKVFFPPTKPICYKYDLITISGVSDRKGQGRVIEALNRLKQEGINLSYLVVGNGDEDYLRTIKENVKKYSVNVDFLDYCPQDKLNDLLWSSKWFIQPSASEGFGKTYIESIAAGTPVIIPKHLPIVKEDNILSDVNCILHKDESIDSIYSCLKEIDFNKTPDTKVVSQSVDHLKWKNIAQIYMDIYNKYCK